MQKHGKCSYVDEDVYSDPTYYKVSLNVGVGRLKTT